MAFQTIKTPIEIGRMKTRLRAMTRKRDQLAIKVAKTLNLPNEWSLEMVDWNNPEVKNIGEQIHELENNIYNLTWEIAKQEALADNNMDYYHAKVKAHEFIKNELPSIEDEINFFKKNNLVRGRSSLIEAICDNPDYLEEVKL